jgi:hypothetical protein
VDIDSEQKLKRSFKGEDGLLIDARDACVAALRMSRADILFFLSVVDPECQGDGIRRAILLPYCYYQLSTHVPMAIRLLCIK